MAESKEKELTVDAKELAKDPAVNIVEVDEVNIYGQAPSFTEEEKQSGIGVGKLTEVKPSGSAIGIRFDEEDSIQKKSDAEGVKS